MHRGNLHFWLVLTMRLARQNKHSGRHILRPQSVVKFIALRNRNANVGFAVLNQDRRGHAFDLKYGRVFLINFHAFPKSAAEIIWNKSADVFGSRLADKIGDGRTRRSRFKTLGLRDNPLISVGRPIEIGDVSLQVGERLGFAAV